MTAKPTSELVKYIIADMLMMDPQEIRSSQSFEFDLKMGSLDMTELVMLTETRLSVTIQDEEMESVRSVDDFIRLVDYLRRNTN